MICGTDITYGVIDIIKDLRLDWNRDMQLASQIKEFMTEFMLSDCKSFDELTILENLKPEILNSPYFRDATKMASSLGKKVNCSWGLKRLKQEHDLYSKEIVKIILEFEEFIEECNNSINSI